MKEGWRKTTLGDAFTVVTGSTPQKSNPIYFGDYIPLIKPPELLDSVVDTAEDGLSREGALISRIAPAQSILVSCIGNLGKVGINSVPVSFNQQINSILPDTRHALPEFMFYQVLSCDFQCQLEALASGTTISIVNKSKFNGIEIVLPPLDEQQRIVALLDEAFEALATAKANAEQNLQNARALFESHLETVFTKQDPGSEEHALRELIEIQNGFAFKSDEYTDSGYFVIRISNVQDSVITLGNPRFVKLADKRLERFILNEGDILVSLTGNIGRVGVVQEDHLPAVLNQRVARITIRNHSVDRDFLFRFLMSRFFREKIQDAGHRAAQQNVSTQVIETVRLSLPSKEEQQRIVKDFDSFAAETHRLTSLYECKLAALEELKASLLHQAFNGEL